MIIVVVMVQVGSQIKNNMTKEKEQTSSETKIFTFDNKERANALRTEILQNYRRVWVFVYNKSGGRYEVTVANQWCGKLDAETLAAVKELTHRFVHVSKE